MWYLWEASTLKFRIIVESKIIAQSSKIQVTNNSTEHNNSTERKMCIIFQVSLCHTNYASYISF